MGAVNNILVLIHGEMMELCPMGNDVGFLIVYGLKLSNFHVEEACTSPSSV